MRTFITEQARDWKLALMARKALALGLAELAQNKAASGQAGGQAGASVD